MLTINLAPVVLDEEACLQVRDQLLKEYPLEQYPPKQTDPSQQDLFKFAEEPEVEKDVAVDPADDAALQTYNKAVENFQEAARLMEKASRNLDNQRKSNDPNR